MSDANRPEPSKPAASSTRVDGAHTMGVANPDTPGPALQASGVAGRSMEVASVNVLAATAGESREYAAEQIRTQAGQLAGHLRVQQRALREQ